MIIAETARFILRELEDTDLDGMYALDSDPDVHRYLGNKPLQTKEESAAVISNIRWQYAEFGMGRWAVIQKSDGAFAGWAGLKREVKLRPGMVYTDLGYRLRRDFWGRGIATETAKASLEYGFEKLGLERIHAAADIANKASNKVLQKLGLRFIEVFEYENAPVNWYGIARQDYFP